MSSDHPLDVLGARDYREGIAEVRFVATLLLSLPLAQVIDHQTSLAPRMEFAAKTLSLESLIALQRDCRIAAILTTARDALLTELNITPAGDVVVAP